jgi:hypothetical protein
MKSKTSLFLLGSLLIGLLLGYTVGSQSSSNQNAAIPSSYLNSDTLSLKGILGLLKNQKDSLIERTTMADALKWVNNFQYFNETLDTPLLASIDSPSNIKCPNLSEEPQDRIHSWFISEWDLIRLWTDRQSGFGKGFSGIRIYPAIRNQSYVLNDEIKVHENAMTFVICPTYESNGKHENQYNVAGNEKKLKVWEYVDPCPKYCPSVKYNELDLVRRPPNASTYIENCD